MAGWAMALVSCATLRPHALPELPNSDRPAVFVADGAGDYRACSGSIRKTAAQDGVSIEVVTYVWSHGYLHNVVDQTDLEHARERGMQLAELVTKHKARHPQSPVTLLGHSAGSAVVLAAAESLPSGTVERVVLLAPSLSEKYDLRPALTNVNDGIDVFVSENDWVWLGLLVRLFGTTDDPFAARAAGRFGFATRPNDPIEAGLYGKLRVHRWTPAEEATGNDGGHFGAYQPGFLRSKVLPILSR